MVPDPPWGIRCHDESVRNGLVLNGLIIVFRFYSFVFSRTTTPSSLGSSHQLLYMRDHLFRGQVVYLAG